MIRTTHLVALALTLFVFSGKAEPAECTENLRPSAGAASQALEDEEDAEARRKHEERVQQAVADLKGALKQKDAKLRVAAIERWQKLDDDRVAKALRPGLEDDAIEVRDAAISALRWMTNAVSLEELHRFFKRAKKLRKDHEAYASLLRAIGQHGDASSIPILTDGLQADPDKAVMKARAYSLGKIRSVDSIEGLFQILKSIDKNKVQKYMGEIRVALMLLTGKDFGVAQDEWRSWWKKTRREFEMAPKAPRLPKHELELWNRFWGFERQ